MTVSWQETFLQKMWRAAERITGFNSSLHWWLEEFLPSSCSLAPLWGRTGSPDLQLPELWVTGSGTARGTRTNTWSSTSLPAPTSICQTLWLRAQPEAQLPPPLLPQSVSEADLGEWSIFLPPSVLENPQANPGSFPLEMHFLQM